MKPTYSNYKVIFVNGKSRNIHCSSLLEAFCDSILFAMANAWEPAITEITDDKTGFVLKNPTVNFFSPKCN